MSKLKSGHPSLQLITKVQVAPNNTDDSQFPAEALPNLKERIGVDTIYGQLQPQRATIGW
ncbi:MAG: hypothetical protein ACP5QU_04965 [Anaerolineae bacterium]